MAKWVVYAAVGILNAGVFFFVVSGQKLGTDTAAKELGTDATRLGTDTPRVSVPVASVPEAAVSVPETDILPKENVGGGDTETALVINPGAVSGANAMRPEEGIHSGKLIVGRRQFLRPNVPKGEVRAIAVKKK